MKTTITIDCELTDTYGGEANYSWVNRESIEVPEKASDRSIVIAAKKALGLTGVRCVKSDIGDTIELRPIGSCTVAFITPRYY